MDYKKTLNLPTTQFPMKADLLRKEPEIQQKWEKENLYEQIRKVRIGREKYILHDGPPYPTGELHIGTGLNKILKDFIVRFYTMKDFDAPYVPGWDCHGLPIEHRVMQEVGAEVKHLTKQEIRKRCKKYAEKFVKLQKTQFKALGIIGDWEHPYLTFDPKYEAGIIEVFGKLVEKGYIYRSLKPIHWCTKCQTALAEAELEYSNETSTSIYVNFKLVDSIGSLFKDSSSDNFNIMIWTTTPWTLPANLAIAVHPAYEYTAIRYINPKTHEKEITIVADKRADFVMSTLGIGNYEVLGRVRGNLLEGVKYKHAFIQRTSSLVLAEYVTLSNGTGCVHTAPGHGQEDFITGNKYHLPVLSPVDASGAFTAEAGEFVGQTIKEGNVSITNKLENEGKLLYKSDLVHSYPHCWRCKSPVIFRATEQWFVSLDYNNLRQKVLDEIKQVKWIPFWGEGRMSKMVSERPDWCISRQRSWGVPIPAFYCLDCGQEIIDTKIINCVRDIFEKEGADSWFYKDVSHFLLPDIKCTKCGGRSFEKEMDIFDVWFESGSSHHAVLHKRSELSFPADLYLEGTDQHRGWFQLSLLPSVGAWNKAPYKSVLTHGFVVDEMGEKMSKSLGNFISVEDTLKEFGADVIRLWTSSMDYQNDMNVSRNLIVKCSDAYRRIRNTFRYLLSNLYDFDPRVNTISYDSLLEIDRWALHKTQELVKNVTAGYESLQFHKVFHNLYNFCSVEMSAFYLDILKDRLYTFAKNSVERRAAQTVLYRILIDLVKVSAPIIVHTAEEVWSAIIHKGEDVTSIHLTKLPKYIADSINESLSQKWERLIAIRTDVAKELEKMRAAKLIGNSLEASVCLYTENEELRQFLKNYEKDLPMIFIVSEVKLDKKITNAAVKSELMKDLWIECEVSQHKKCERCWNYRESVGTNEEHPLICDRCVTAIQ
ncbi:MAG TPA: isoleucine--tRNA ligase [Candidatus Wujingus californicus]|uniref:isoleucine--tRNA ligase n=2 Tax=Candidatus Wujingus californicus TaxID=3367618 RepID=UPI001E172B84|nr:isoleucine--tRNA ligase [Planctomycetota bacterium]MDO8130638.1 isoleucine--tRNA ligase [Candidatus Brocadiales bacterium]